MEFFYYVIALTFKWFEIIFPSHLDTLYEFSKTELYSLISTLHKLNYPKILKTYLEKFEFQIFLTKYKIFKSY